MVYLIPVFTITAFYLLKAFSTPAALSPAKAVYTTLKGELFTTGGFSVKAGLK